MSFATISDMATRGRKPTFRDDVHMANTPDYGFERQETLAPRWYEWRHWSKRKLIMIVVSVILVLVIIIIVGVVMSKKNGSYPEYKKLTYSLGQTCKYYLSSLRSWRNLILSLPKILGSTSFSNSTTLLGTTQPPALFTMFLKSKLHHLISLTQLLRPPWYEWTLL